MDQLLALLWGIGVLAAGAGVLGLMNLRPARGLDHVVLAYWVGYAAVGAALFVPATGGFFSLASIWALPLVLAPLGVWNLARRRWARPALSWQVGAALAVFALLTALNFLGALAPPTEADSLAYHFVIAREVAETGRLVFKPVAVEWAVPLLTHLHSAAGWAMGGEAGMVFTCWFSAVMSGVAVAALARRWLSPGMAWLAAALVYGAPMFLYGAVTGTVETKMVGLTAAAGLALVGWASTGRLAWVATLGVLAGGLMAAKFFGLFGATVLGLATLAVGPSWPRRLAGAVLMGVATLAVGGCWYGWLAFHTGDPVFPALFGLLGTSGWSPAQEAFWQTAYIDDERRLPRTLGWFLAYPFDATLNPTPYDAGRTGAGPLFLFFLLAGAGAAAVAARRWVWGRARLRTLEVLMLAVLVFYALWFFLGVSGRVRHLLPMLPFLWVVGLFLTARAWAAGGRVARVGLATLVGAALAVNAAAAVLLNSDLRFLRGPEGREAYLSRKAQHYDYTRVLNTLNVPGVRLFHSDLRTLNYYLKTPYIYGLPYFQEIVPLATGTPQLVMAAWARLGVTHVFTLNNPENHSYDLPQNRHSTLRALIGDGCLRLEGVHRGKIYPSRTGGLGERIVTYHLYSVQPRCF
jgi:hypothetical protein